MLCFWRDWKEIVHYELLSPNETIILGLNCQKSAGEGVVFYYGHAGPGKSEQLE